MNFGVLLKIINEFASPQKQSSATMIPTPEDVSAVIKLLNSIPPNAFDFKIPTPPGLIALSESLAQLLQLYADAPGFWEGFTRTPSPEHSEKIAASIDLARPYMTPEQTSTADELLPKVKNRFTLDTALNLLSFLLALITFLFTVMPNAQLEKLNEQNDDLTTAIKALNESVLLLQEEIDILTDESDGLCDENDGSSEPDKQNGQPELDQSSGEIADTKSQ